jgi:hypothetical protein
MTRIFSFSLPIFTLLFFLSFLSACDSHKLPVVETTAGLKPENTLSSVENVQNPIETGTLPSTQTTTTDGTDDSQSSPLEDEIDSSPDPLDYLLGLRSITIDLSSRQPDGSESSLQIAIDNKGDMVVKSIQPVYSQVPTLAPNNTPGKVDSPKASVSSEVLVVGGKAYQKNDELAAIFDVDPWMTTPVDEDFISTLSTILHGANGVALWLDILPEGSLTAAGDDSVGGFAAHKYTVKGTVQEQEITGTLWYEPESGALIKADLVVPGALYNLGMENPTGQYTVKLETKKSNIAEVVLPAAPVLPTDVALAPTALPKEVNLPAEGVSSPPAIAATYPVDMTSGMGGMFGKLETSPGKVWLGLINTGIQEVDAASGTISQTIPMPEVNRFWDIKHDGKYLWVLASKENASEADGLYVIDPGTKAIVKEWHDFKDGDFGWQPVALGLSPGMIWVANKIINTGTLEEIPMGKGFVLPVQAHFAYDGKQWMWANGSRCDGCGHDLWMFDSADPATVKDDNGTGEANASTMNMPLITGGGKMWVGAFKNTKTVNWIYVSDTYLSGYDFNKTDKPSVSVDVSGEVGDPNWITSMTAGSRFLWLFGSAYTPPTLFYHDLNSGKVLGKLPLETYALSDMSFDGKDLWVLGMDKLIRISQP